MSQRLPSALAEVDPDDDPIWRWVIYHGRFDRARRERREVVVAAYDNAAEFHPNFSGIAPVFAEETSGIAPDPQSRIVSGRVLHRRYREEPARGHLVRRAVEHGVDPRRLPAGGRLPSNVAAFGIGDDGEPFHFGGWQPPEPPGRPRRFSRSLRRVIARG